jgi:toxin ParE1/3/4
VKVIWTQNAVAHLEAIRNYIAQDSDRYAAAMIDRLTSRSRQLSIHPQSGGVVIEYDRPDVREVIEGSYRIIYRLNSDRIDVLAVIHSARRLPGDLA